MTSTPAPPTGGQINVAGILYQMLVSLADGLETTITQYADKSDPSPTVLHVEPFDGGDVQIESRGRIVIQIKTRSARRRWTSGLLIRDVLPDLYTAAGSRQGDRYQFVTDNDAGCEEFRQFLSWFRERDSTAAIEPPMLRIGQGGKLVTADTMLLHIADTLEPDRVDDARVHRFLASLEILKRQRSDIFAAIDRFLMLLVEKPEELTHKRKQLIGELVELGSTGTRTTTRRLLERADLDPRRLMLATLMPGNLERRLAARFKSLGYEPKKDVRPPMAAPRLPITILRGESGLGKTWRLCATAQAMCKVGKLVMLVRASANLQALKEEIAGAIWNPVFNSVAPLASVAQRLRTTFADDRGVWLTVFLDDLNDPELARRILDDDWAALGIDIVASCQPNTADWLRQSGAVPDVIEVPAFNVEELVRYLDDHGVEFAQLADDVFDLLFKLVLAKLFCRLPHGSSLRAETEYELMNSFWRHAATERDSHVRHPFDLDRLLLVVEDMLGGYPAYPWPLSSFVRWMEDEVVFRLIEAGVVELDGDRRLSMTHDRLLNWAVASHLASKAIERNLAAPQLLALFQDAENLVTTAGINIGGRLGYVLMDMVWLMLGPGQRPPAQVAEFLLAYMRAPESSIHDQAFFYQLTTLGTRAVPVLQAIIEADFAGEREAHWPVLLSKALRNVADVAWQEVQGAASALLRSGDASRVEIALPVIAKVGSRELVGELFALNMKRKSVLDASPIDNRVAAIQSKERAFEAFTSAVAGAPGWLDERIAGSTDTIEAEQLLWALVRIDRSVSLDIWINRRDHLFATINPDARILPRAVRTFGDPADLVRLEFRPLNDAEMLQNAVTFDAIARLDPSRAIEILRGDEGAEAAVDLLGTVGWWMPGLHYRMGDKTLGSALRARSRRDKEFGAGDRLARHYSGASELIDPKSVDMILDELECVTGDFAVPAEERLRRSYRLVSVLSSLRSTTTLECVARRRGSSLEDRLADLACSRPATNSRNVDREGEMITRILAMMGGDGFDRLVLAQIGSDGRTTAEYGMGYALWTSAEAVGERLQQIALDRTDAALDRPYHLMQALAAHGRDEGLARLIEGSSPVFTDATNIRLARTGDPANLIALINAKGSSDSIDDRVQAVDLAYFVEPERSIELTVPLIAVAVPGDALARRLLMQHFQFERYDPALLSRIEPFLDDGGNAGPVAALHLAINGDAHARGVAVCWLADHGLEDPQPRNVQAAFALLEHDDSREGALAFLQKFKERDMGFGRLNADVLEALARHGDDAAAQQLVNLAFGSMARDLDAVAGAVRIVSSTNSHGAFQAARRLFVKSGKLEGARILMDVDPARGVVELMQAYLGANTVKRLAIARTLRSKAPMAVLLPALMGLAGSEAKEERRIAAEIAGWLRHDLEIPWLAELTSDPVQEVEEAALDALQRRRAGEAAVGLMAAIPGYPKPRQWAALRALIDLIDPNLLSLIDDPLDIRTVLNALPAEFAIEAQRILDRRHKELERKERDAARKEQ